MAQVTANGIQIEVETHGDPANPPLMIIMGLGSQLTHWPDELVDAFVEDGFYVIRHDNRDVGLSQKFDEAGIPSPQDVIGKILNGEDPGLAYTLPDMAADAIGVLDALNIDKAHIMGVSMGGMIVQEMAADYPDRILSMTSIMSTTGRPGLPQATPEANAVLMTPPPSSERDDVIEHTVKNRKVIGSPGFPTDDDRAREYAARNFDRCYHPQGVARQLCGVIGSPSRLEKLEKVATPTLVIHGKDDPLVPVEGGIDTAKTIPGARLELIDGYGHDVPVQLVPQLVELIGGHAEANG